MNPPIKSCSLTIEHALKQAKETLANSESDSSALDAELLLARTLDQSRTYLYTWPEKHLSQSQAQTFFQLIEQRQKGLPVAHLLQEREFWGLLFKVTEHTLIPRPDTETLVETALEKLEQAKPHSCQAWSILDLGTGSGAIACALAASLPRNPPPQLTAVDLCPQALEVARWNAQRHHLNIDFQLGRWFAPLQGQTFDLIVSNPPYIAEEDPHLCQGDVRFEPTMALTSGRTGLDDLTEIIQQAPKHLYDNGWLLLEHGYDQADAVQSLLQIQGFSGIETRQDLHGHPRITCGQWNHTIRVK